MLIRWIGILLLAAGVVPAHGARTVPIVDYDDRTVATPAGQPSSAERVRDAIIAGGGPLGWQFTPAGEGKLIGTLVMRRKFRVEIDIEYRAEAYSVRYRRSVGLPYPGDGTIHPSYNTWVAQLVNRIDLALSLETAGAAGQTRSGGPARARESFSEIPAARSFGEPRHALVIGNANYVHGPLKNPLNDARAMAKELSQSGFEVLLVEDATQTGMLRAVRGFGDQIAKGGVGLFYYAGHGIQAKGRNFLLPVNADIDREYEIEFTSVDVNMVLSMMDAAKNPLNIVILDACRNNPFARSFKIAATGLAPMDAPSGTFIAFATAPGAIASDGTGANGIYTKHLLAQIGKPGVPIEQLFKQVRIGVMQETNGRQTPWESSSLRGEFAFRPGVAPSPQADVAAAVSEALQRARESQRQETEQLIQAALERQRKDFEEQGARPVLARPEPEAPGPAPVAAPIVTASVLPSSVAPASAAAAGNSRLPQAGDRWTYRLRQFKSAAERRYVVEVVAASGSGVLDRASIDGGPPSEWAHSSGAYLVAQGMPLFSPYLALFEQLTVGAPLAKIQSRDQVACRGQYACKATGRVAGRETLRTAAGSFETIKAVIEQEWYPGQQTSFSADMWGSRTLTVWYAPQIKRAVRYSSRVTAGTSTDADFDLELLSYNLN